MAVTLRHSIEAWVLDAFGAVLLLHVPRSDDTPGDFWQPITGGRMAGESAADACLRELFEETGLGRASIAGNELIASGIRVEVGADTVIDKTVFVVMLNIVAPAIALSPYEHDGSRWTAPSDVPAALTWESNCMTWGLVLDRQRTVT